MSAETKWTPGPWEVHGETIMADPRSHLPDTMLGIADMCDFRGDRPERVTKANARLIAAAPNLYAALERFVSVCDSAPPVELIHHIGEACKEARDVLAKARGEQ